MSVEEKGGRAVRLEGEGALPGESIATLNDAKQLIELSRQLGVSYNTA